MKLKERARQAGAEKRGERSANHRPQSKARQRRSEAGLQYADSSDLNRDGRKVGKSA